MSYIRCLGNPEGLYIWADIYGRVNLSLGTIALRGLSLPTHVFEGLMDKFRDDGMAGNVSYRGARMVQSDDYSRWTLHYKDWGKIGVTAYEVTWAYVASHTVKGSKRP